MNVNFAYSTFQMIGFRVVLNYDVYAYRKLVDTFIRLFHKTLHYIKTNMLRMQKKSIHKNIYINILYAKIL